MIQTYIQLRFKFRDMSVLRTNEPAAAQQLREEIAEWELAAQSLSSTSNDEFLVRDRLENKINQLKQQLKKQLGSGKIANDLFEQTLEDLQQKVRTTFSSGGVFACTNPKCINILFSSTVSDSKS